MEMEDDDGDVRVDGMAEVEKSAGLGTAQLVRSAARIVLRDSPSCNCPALAGTQTGLKRLFSR